MKKIIFTLSIMLTLIFAFSYTTFAATNDIPTEVLKAANEGLTFMTTKIQSSPEKYGFDSNFDDKTIKLGKGFKLYYINTDKFNNLNTNNLLDLCDSSKFWLFTVKVNDKSKSFLTVGYEKGRYIMVHFGGNSQLFDESLANYNALVNDDNPHVVKTKHDYYLVNKSKTKELVVPSTAKTSSIQFNNTEIIDSAEIIKALKSNRTPGINRGTSNLQPNKQTNNNLILVTILALLGIISLSSFHFKRSIHNK